MDKNNFSTFLRNNINDTFWDNYIKLVRNEMIPYQLMALNDEIDGAPKSYCLENFKKTAKVIQKINNNEKIEIYPVDRWEYKENECDKNSFLGWCFQDSDVYKWIEAVAYSLKNTKDNALEQKSDEIINLICNAQMENGYLDTLYIINDRSKIFTNLKDRHELYCFGHLAEAAVAYYESTGKDIYNTLIVSAPCCGKTTLLRDIVRNISDGFMGHAGMTVGIADERSEIAACNMGVPQNDVGMRTDVLDGCMKSQGMMMLIRSMSPGVVAVDEIGSDDDVQAIRYAVNCGCRIIATVHATSMEELYHKIPLKPLLGEKVFERIILLGNREHIGSITGIYDGEGNII